MCKIIPTKAHIFMKSMSLRYHTCLGNWRRLCIWCKQQWKTVAKWSTIFFFSIFEHSVDIMVLQN